MKNNLKKTRAVINKLVIAVVICAILSMLAGATTLGWLLLVPLVICIVAACVISWRYLRCPHCGARLSAGHLSPDRNHCPCCGTALDV